MWALVCLHFRLGFLSFGLLGLASFSFGLLGLGLLVFSGVEEVKMRAIRYVVLERLLGKAIVRGICATSVAT